MVFLWRESSYILGKGGDFHRNSIRGLRSNEKGNLLSRYCPSDDGSTKGGNYSCYRYRKPEFPYHSE